MRNFQAEGWEEAGAEGVHLDLFSPWNLKHEERRPGPLKLLPKSSHRPLDGPALPGLLLRPEASWQGWG